MRLLREPLDDATALIFFGIAVAIAQALELTLEQRRELFYTAFPEFYVWDEAAEHGYTVDETNDLLHGRGLPLLTSDK